MNSQSSFPDIIPVSEKEIQEWLDNLPNLSALPSRREAYRKAYNIEDKIRNQKRKESNAQNSNNG